MDFVFVFIEVSADAAARGFRYVCPGCWFRWIGQLVRHAWFMTYEARSDIMMDREALREL